MIMTGLLLLLPLAAPSIASSQDRIILCNESCEARKVERREEERQKLANSDDEFVGRYSFEDKELDNRIFDYNKDKIDKYGFIDLNEPSFKEGRMRLGAKRKTMSACRKVHQVRLAADDVEPYRVNVAVDFDDSKTSCTENSCSVSGDCSFLGLGQFSLPIIWTNTLFGIHRNSKPSIKERNMADEFNIPSAKSCQVLDSVYVEGKESSNYESEFH